MALPNQTSGSKSTSAAEQGTFPAAGFAYTVDLREAPNQRQYVIPGLTKREAFAMAAMQALAYSGASAGDAAAAAVDYADALLLALYPV